MFQVKETQIPALEFFPRNLNFTDHSYSYWCEKGKGVLVGMESSQSLIREKA